MESEGKQEHCGRNDRIPTLDLINGQNITSAKNTGVPPGREGDEQVSGIQNNWLRLTNPQKVEVL